MLFDRSTPVHLVLNDTTDPPFNLACEEYLSKAAGKLYHAVGETRPRLSSGATKTPTPSSTWTMCGSIRYPLFGG